MGRVFELRDQETGRPIGTLVTVDDLHAGAVARQYLRIDRVQIEPGDLPEPVPPAAPAAPAKPLNPAPPKRTKR